MAGYAIGNALFMKPNQNQPLNPTPRTATTVEANQDGVILTEQQKIILQEKIDNILADLQIENMQDKPAEEQRQVAVKILQYVVDSTKFIDDKTHNNNQAKGENDEVYKAYQSLCAGNNVDYTTAESIATELLLNATGINAQRMTLRNKPKSINPGVLSVAPHGEHDVVYFKVTGGETLIADPLYARLLANHIKQTNDVNAAVDNMDDYCNQFRYEFVSAHEKLDLAPVLKAAPTVDMGMER